MVTISLFIVQRWIQYKEEFVVFINQKEAYLYSLADEVGTIEELLKSPHVKDSEYEILEVVFPFEAYEKFPLEEERLERGSLPTLRDFYHHVRIRNRLYLHRLESKHNFFTSTGFSIQSWYDFVSELDGKIKDYEDFMKDFVGEVKETVKQNLENTTSIKKSWKTRFGIRTD